MRPRGSLQLRSAPSRVTGPESATRARRATGASFSAVTFGAATTTGRAMPPVERSSEPRARTTARAAASRSRRRPACSGTVRMRSPRRTSAALSGFRSVLRAIRSRANSRAALETAMRGRISAPKTRVCRRRNPRMGPNPSPARPAAATAARQSGSTPSWFAAKENDSSPARNVTGSFSTSENRSSSLATASRCVSPPTSTPATCVPSASTPREPANASPRRTPTSARTPATRASDTNADRLRPRRRTRGG